MMPAVSTVRRARHSPTQLSWVSSRSSAPAAPYLTEFYDRAPLEEPEQQVTSPPKPGLDISAVDTEYVYTFPNTLTDYTPQLPSLTFAPNASRIVSFSYDALLAHGSFVQVSLPPLKPSFGVVGIHGLGSFVVDNFNVVQLSPPDVSGHATNPAAFTARRMRASTPDEWERALMEMVDLPNDPEFDGVPPARVTIASIEALLPAIRTLARVPEFNLHDDGSVSLRWRDPAAPRSFALHFGTKRVSAVLSQPTTGGGFSEGFGLTDEVGLVGVMQRSTVARLIR